MSLFNPDIIVLRQTSFFPFQITNSVSDNHCTPLIAIIIKKIQSIKSTKSELHYKSLIKTLFLHMKEMAEKRKHLTLAILAIYFGGGQVYVYCEDHKNTTLFLNSKNVNE